uniref:BHLH domain-containing protein n=1 Tax=Xiphophorus couchianus TaxID=32473 RepID=A0A3B5LB88_9TELE
MPRRQKTADAQKPKNPKKINLRLTFLQVSKPLMEKKRRARINQCLDELKSLLENVTLPDLQKIQISAGASELPDYQLGFRNCLANVNQYLLLADHLSGSERWVMSQLSNKLCRSRRGGEASSTTDSDPIKLTIREKSMKSRPRSKLFERYASTLAKVLTMLRFKSFYWLILNTLQNGFLQCTTKGCI